MMANAELQASNITTPNGNLTLCYDEMGDCCKVPEYCFVDPIELGANDRDRVPASNGLFKGFMMTSILLLLNIKSFYNGSGVVRGPDSARGRGATSYSP